MFLCTLFINMSDLFQFNDVKTELTAIGPSEPTGPSMPSGPLVPSGLPLYRDCKHLFGSFDSPGYITFQSMCSELGLSETKVHAAVFHLLVDHNVDAEWSGDKWISVPARKPEPCVSVPQIRSFLDRVLRRKRMNRLEKANVYEHFGITLTTEEVSVLPAPVENQLLFMLQQAMPYKMEYQYRVGKYRLDAFIPRLRIAIQIDENGHSSYPVEEEQAYNEAIRDANIVCIRFNVARSDNDAHTHLRLIRQVWERSVSPEVVAFRHMNQLH